MDYTLSQYDYLQGQEGESDSSGAIIPRVMEIDPSDDTRKVTRTDNGRKINRAYLFCIT